MTVEQRIDPDEIAGLKAEIERLREVILEVMTTRPDDPSRPYEVFTADISWKPRAAKACGVEVLEKTRFVSSGMVIKDDEDGAA